MSELNFENLLDDRLFTTAELLGFLNKTGADTNSPDVLLATDWFENPATKIKEMFGTNKREALQKFVTDVLGSSNSWLEGGAPDDGSSETWHSIPTPEQTPSGLYLVLRHCDENLFIGLGGIYQKNVGSGVDEVAIKLSGNIPVVKVDGDGNWHMALTDPDAPSCFALRLHSVQGNLLKDNPLISLGGVSLKLTLGSSVQVDLVLEQLKLPGETVGRSRTLTELCNSYNLSFVLNLFLDGLTDSISEPLRNVLGMSPDFPSIDWDKLATGDTTCLRDWFTELCFGATPKIKNWLAEFAKLLGLGTLTVKGDGTRKKPWFIPLSADSSDFLSKLHLTLAVESAGTQMAYPGISVAFDSFDMSPLQLHAKASSELVGIDLQNGALTLLPSLCFDLELTGDDNDDGFLDLIPADSGAAITLSSPAVSLSAELGSASAGVSFTSVEGLSAYLELHDVDINGRHWDVMDLNGLEAGLDSAVDAAKDLVLDALRDAIGIGETPSYASLIGALIGLNAPISAPSWDIDLVIDGGYLTTFLNDPLQAVAWYHSRVAATSVTIDAIENRSVYHYLMQDLYVLLKGEGTLAGFGTSESPWELSLLSADPNMVLQMVVENVSPVPRLQITVHAECEKTPEESGSFLVKGDVQARVVDIVLPDVATGETPATCVWLASAQFNIGFSGLPALTMGGLTLCASTLKASVGWAREGGLSYDLGLTGLEINYQAGSSGSARLPFSWGTLSLPALGFGGDDSGWLPENLTIATFGPVLLELYGQWLSSTSPKGFALAGLLGLLPDMGRFQLADSDYPTWDNSPWALPDDWPALQFENWDNLFENPWDEIKRHLTHLFSRPEWALPALRWLGALLSDCLPDLSKPDFNWDLGKDDENDRDKKRFPTLPELPFLITGHGTYEDPWKLQIKERISTTWHKGALLVWLDPDGPPAMNISSMATLVAPHLASAALDMDTTDTILTEFDLDGMLDLVGKLGMVNSEVARHCKGFDARLTAKLEAVEAWLRQSDGFCRIPLALGENVVNGRLQNVTPIADLDVACLDEQLDHFGSELNTFIGGIAGSDSLRLVLVGDEHTQTGQWDTLLKSKLALGNEAIQQHDFCEYGVAPDQQALTLDTGKRATIVKLTSLNTAPDQFGWLPLDRLGDNTPARQLERVINHLQGADSAKLIVITHASAGFAARVVLDGMVTPATKIAGLCAVGMPDVPEASGQPFGIDASGLPGVLSEEVLQGVDYLHGLIAAGETKLQTALATGLTSLCDWYSSSNGLGYDGLISPEQLPERAAGLFERIPALKDHFTDVVCKGLYSRLVSTAEDAVASISIKRFLMSWLVAQLDTTPSETEPSHVGFGVSWEDDHIFGENQEFLMHSQTRFDVMRFGLSDTSSEADLQPLPRTRFALDIHRRDAWLIGARNHAVRCRWMEFALDISPESYVPNVVFHDAGVNAGQLQRIGLESFDDVLWTAENHVRVLLQKLCDALPAPAVSTPLSCFMTGSGLFYEENNKLLPHVNSWQAVLIDPRRYFTTRFQVGLQDPLSDQAQAFTCLFGNVFGLENAPFIKQLITIMTTCGTDPESRICLIIMQALELFTHTQDGCFPVLLNWVRFLQNPKIYLQTAWATFTANNDEAQAKRAVLVAALAVEIQNLNASDTPAPKWLHDVAFDGNQITFFLGGQGFDFLSAGMRLRIPVVIDFINGYVQIRFEFDASGIIGISLPVGCATAFGGIKVFFDVLVQANQNAASLRYGLDLGGGATFDLAIANEWKHVLQRLLTQGMCRQFVKEIKEQITNEKMQRFVSCFDIEAIEIPGSVLDLENYFDASSLRCLLNRTGDLLEVRNEALNSWDLGPFAFTYPVPPNPDDLEFHLKTQDSGLQLYHADEVGEVVLHSSLGLLFPKNGTVRVDAECTVETNYSGIEVDFYSTYASSTGTVCTLTAQGVTIGLYPFTGFADILGSMEAILDQCLPAIFDYLGGDNVGALRHKFCALAQLFCQHLPDLRIDLVQWLRARLALRRVQTQLNTLFSEYGLRVNTDGVLTYRYLVDSGFPDITATANVDESKHIALEISLGPNVGAQQTDLGLAFSFTPPPIESVSLSFDMACWLDVHGAFQLRSECQFGLAPRVLIIGEQSIEPTLNFDFDTSKPNNDIKLRLILPGPGGDPFVTLSLLPVVTLALHGSVKQLVEPLLNGILSTSDVGGWLDDGQYNIGNILISLQVLNKTEGSYKVDLTADWSDARAVLERILGAVFDAPVNKCLVEFGDNEGGIYVEKDGDWYGVRVVHPGLRVCNDPEIDLVLGSDTKWITDEGCGLKNDDGTAVREPGLSVFFLKKQGSERPIELACRFVFSDVGLCFRGKNDQKLFDIKGVALKGIGLHGYVDMDVHPGSSPVKWALGCELIDFALPINNATGQDNPVANSLLASSAENAEPINPAFDISFACGDTFTAFIGDKNSKDGVAWMDISKQFGPVYIQSLGIQLVDDNLSILIDGKIEMMGLTIAVDDLSLTLPILTPFNTEQWQIGCKGLGVSYVSDGLVVSGALLVKGSGAETEYSGVCIIETSGTSFSAIGSYAQIGNDPSLFVFVVVNMTIGGPPMFFIRGFAGGFGYNRDFRAPQINNVEDFSLVGLATGALSKDPLAILDDPSFPPTRGSYWFAAGVKFTTFELFKSFGLLYVLLNRGLEVGLLGRTELDFPEEKPLVHVAMNFKALFSSSKGYFEARAQLTNDSWLFDPNCKLQGGFAVASWFAGEHKGDFVITLGGYHADYKKPEHYPDVPRLGFNWQVSKAVSIKGSSYFALTSNAVMAGGELDASYKDGALKAWFKVWANLLVQWKPFFYSFDVGVSIGASYRMSVRIPFVGRISKTFKVELGGELKIWGPDFSGVATLNWCIISFSVPFGANNGKKNLPALTWDEFCRDFLPVEDGVKKYLNIHAEKGLLEDQDGVWLLKSECVLRTETVFPISKTTIGLLEPVANGEKIDLKPMQLSSVVSSHSIDIEDDQNNTIMDTITWSQPDQAQSLYIRMIAGQESVSRMRIVFDTQEVAKALWEFDIHGDPLAPGTPLTAAMGMSIHFYIDNKTVLEAMNIIDLNQNDTSDCVMPLPLNVNVYQAVPFVLGKNWLDVLNLAPEKSKEMVAAIYSAEWSARRQVAIAEMRRQGAELMNEADLVSSRLHHLAQRKAMPQVSTLYNGVSDIAESTKMSPLYQQDESQITLQWSLSVVSLPMRYVTNDAAVVTHIRTLSGTESLPIISLDRFSKGLKSGDGQMLKVGQSRYGGRRQYDQRGRVLVPRGKAGGAAQRALREQLVRGLNDTSEGAILQAGMVQIWRSTEPVGKVTRFVVDGKQAVRLSCFDNGSGLLSDQEYVGETTVRIPEETRMVTVTGLGASFLEKDEGRAGGVSLRSGPHKQFLCGWNSGDLLPQISGNTLLCRGGMLQSSDNVEFRAEPALVQVATFLNKRKSCVTILPSSVRTVGVLVAKATEIKNIDADLDIQFSDTFTVTKGKTISYGKQLLCLFGVVPKDETENVSRLSVAVRGRSGWMLAGVCGGIKELLFWESEMDLSTPPQVSQDICAGSSSEVFIQQEGLSARLEAYQDVATKQAEKRKEYANIWKRKTV